MIRRLRSVLAVTLLALAAPATAQETDPFDGISSIVSWFTELNAKWQQVVTEQERAQLLRAVARLDEELYKLEADTRRLQEAIPDQAPTAPERLRLRATVNELRASLGRVRLVARKIGNEVRRHGGVETELRVDRAGTIRAVTLDYLDTVIRPGGDWRPGEIRQRLGNAVDALNKAQLSVSAFRNKLGQPGSGSGGSA